MKDNEIKWRYISEAKKYIDSGYDVYFCGLKVLDIGHSNIEMFNIMYDTIDIYDEKLLIPGIKTYFINEYDSDELLANIKIKNTFLREILDE